jgi:hypothetical protein
MRLPCGGRIKQDYGDGAGLSAGRLQTAAAVADLMFENKGVFQAIAT